MATVRVLAGVLSLIAVTGCRSPQENWGQATLRLRFSAQPRLALGCFECECAPAGRPWNCRVVAEKSETVHFEIPPRRLGAEALFERLGPGHASGSGRPRESDRVYIVDITLEGCGGARQRRIAGSLEDVRAAFEHDQDVASLYQDIVSRARLAKMYWFRELVRDPDYDALGEMGTYYPEK